MNTAEALATIEFIEIQWPTFSIPDPTKQQWAMDIVANEPSATGRDGYEAIRELAAAQVYPPKLKEIIDAIYQERLDRQRREGLQRPVLTGPRHEDACTLAEFLEANPDMRAEYERVKNDSVIGAVLRRMKERDEKANA